MAASFVILMAMAPPVAAQPDRDFGAIILCYHEVGTSQDVRWGISTAAFRQQMQYLAMTGYNVIPLRDVFEYASGKRASLPKNAVVITFDDGWRSTYTEVFPEMKRLGLPFTVFVYPKIINKTSISLTWKQVREMANAGVDIQSHTLSHGYLTRGRHPSASDEQYSKWLERELVESKQVLECETGRSVDYLAYPYGDYDRSVQARASRAGYQAALTCDYGRVKRGSDPHRMKRAAIDSGTDFAAFRRLLGAGDLRLAEMTPQPGNAVQAPETAMTVAARIHDFDAVDPLSVGLALLSGPGTVPYSYDPRSGAISLTVKEAQKGTLQRALVWAHHLKSGQRIEATWTFRLPGEPPQTIADAGGGGR